MRRSIVFLDIDGTLIDDSQRLPDSARAALVAARSAGHALFLCSGRSVPEIYPWLLDVGFDGVIASAGSFARVGDRTLFEHLIPSVDVDAVSAYFDGHGVDYVWQSSTGVFPSAGYLERFRARFAGAVPAVTATAGRGGAVGGPADPAEAGLLQLLDVFEKAGTSDGVRRAGKGTFICDPRRGLRLADVQRHFAGRFDVIPGSIDALGPDNGELMLRGVNKGVAALAVARRLGFPREATVGVGDSANDIELVRDCGIGVAMGNARPAVKAVADVVTDDIDADGLAHAFASLGLVP